MRKTAKLIDDASASAKAGSTAEAVTFDFGPSRVTEEDLDTWAKCSWFARVDARVSKGETVPKPEPDEVIVFREFFLAGLRFPVASFVLRVLKRFWIRFHQLNPSCFTKLSAFVWACKSQGVEADLDAFVRTHRVHTQPRKVEADGVSSACQYGVYTFCYRHGVELPVQAQKNKRASPWLEQWFCWRLEVMRLRSSAGICLCWAALTLRVLRRMLV